MTRRLPVVALLLLLLASRVPAQTPSPVWALSRLAWTLEKHTLAEVNKSGGFRLYLDADIPEVPPATTLVDASGARWSLDAWLILRDGSNLNGGAGSILLSRAGVIYALGTDDSWWRFANNTWTPIGSTKPTGGIVLTGVTCRTAAANVNCDAPIPTSIAPGPHTITITWALNGLESPFAVAVPVVFMAPTGVGVR